MELMCKITGTFLVLAASTAICYRYCLRIKERYRMLEEWKKCMVILKGEIAYAKTVMPEALYYLSKNSSSPFTEFFGDVAGGLEEKTAKTFGEIWGKKCEHYFGHGVLGREDAGFLAELGSSLSIQDAGTLLQTLQLYITRLGERIEKERQQMSEKLRIYRLLGISFGITVVVVLI